MADIANASQRHPLSINGLSQAKAINLKTAVKMDPWCRVDGVPACSSLQDYSSMLLPIAHRRHLPVTSLKWLALEPSFFLTLDCGQASNGPRGQQLMVFKSDLAAGHLNGLTEGTAKGNSPKRHLLSTKIAVKVPLLTQCKVEYYLAGKIHSRQRWNETQLQTCRDSGCAAAPHPTQREAAGSACARAGGLQVPRQSSLEPRYFLVGCRLLEASLFSFVFW